jgi:Flp pilus assembly protein TadD
VDVAPTLLELAGVAPPDIMQGESLVTMLADPEAGVNRTAYSEAWQAHEAFGMAPLRAVYDGNWKLVEAPEPELFDLSTDPGETANLASAHSDLVRAMRQALDRLSGTETSDEGEGGVVITDETAAALDALGYTAVGGGGSPRGSDENPLHHKEIIEAYALASRVMTTDPERAQLLLAEVVLANPEAPGPFFRQMRLLMARGTDDERIEFCREVITARPESKLPRLHLAQLLVRAGRIEDGIGELELLLLQAPEYAAGYLELGRALLAAGDTERARARLEEARRLAPRDVDVLIAIARVDSAEGDRAAAVATLESAALMAPDSAAVRNELVRARRARDESP